MLYSSDTTHPAQLLDSGFGHRLGRAPSPAAVRFPPTTRDQSGCVYAAGGLFPRLDVPLYLSQST